MRKSFFISLMFSLGLLLLVVGTGCRTPASGDSGADELPWNSPASWEGRTLGAPY